MSVKENVTANQKKYKLVPPDGGFGYLIIVSSILHYSSIASFVGCFGLIYNDFMKEIGITSTRVNLLLGITALCIAAGAFFTNSFLKIMSKRKLALVAAITFDLGTLGTVFAKSEGWFFFYQAIVQGLGSGFFYSLVPTILNDYFVTKRLFAFSFVQTITAICAMIAPMFVKWSLDTYGYRGTLLFIAGLSIHNIIAAVLMQPVEWHMKRVEIVDKNEMQILLLEEKKERKEKEANAEVPTVKLTDVECPTAAVSDNEKVYDFTKPPKKKSCLRRVIESIIDLSVTKQLLLSCVSYGPALCGYADGGYSLILPQALYAKEWDQYNVALALSFVAFGDLVTRFLLIFTSKCLLKLGSQEVYVIGIAVAFLSRFAMMWTQNKILILICLSLTGAAHCIICVLIPMVVSDVVSPEKFTSAMGVVMMLTGVTFIILGPAIGAIRDLTNSYAVANYIFMSCYAIIVLFWSIELVYKKNKHKRVQREIALKTLRANKK
ncbi:hypothetical protein O3G_MSEX011722 [Manduca sexta]|uniref:Major facilitator superfamily (MFS) profile domain-containing protein n=1 Tax=Manduca sexta TaxID=7130 RepID=A0A922CVN1_MANSE|nr:hypothetical protein O3G_MSEX011722 [Manduca sexta]